MSTTVLEDATAAMNQLHVAELQAEVVIRRADIPDLPVAAPTVPTIVAEECMDKGHRVNNYLVRKAVGRSCGHLIKISWDVVVTVELVG